MVLALFAQAGIEGMVCRDVPDVASKLADDVAFVFITDEAVRGVDLRPLQGWIATQPKWSDLPFILVTDRGGSPDRNPLSAQMLEALANVSFIERPFHP
ncbi:MAG: hybrid sensor histidine kinase/response regulator, partial [Caldimonas sp.]